RGPTALANVRGGPPPGPAALAARPLCHLRQSTFHASINRGEHDPEKGEDSEARANTRAPPAIPSLRCSLARLFPHSPEEYAGRTFGLSIPPTSEVRRKGTSFVRLQERRAPCAPSVPRHRRHKHPIEDENTNVINAFEDICGNSFVI
ncbi:hypothetical protein Taro_030540, partial [Colocasia esculenta]|nr:hypothetical protein [Colocasia esculenta]